MKNRSNNGTPLVVVGYDFKRASAKWRSLLVLKKDEQDELSLKLVDAGMASGMMVLSTCNRNELIASSATPEWTGEILRANLISRLKRISGKSKVPEPYIYVGGWAVRHMVRVAAGMESFIMGERQIASQLNSALSTSRKLGHVSVILNGLGSSCGRAAKESVNANLSGNLLRGVHDAAIRYLEMNYDPKQRLQVLVVGAGEIGSRVLNGINARTNWIVNLANRSATTCSNLVAKPLSDLSALIKVSQVVIICTGAFTPVLLPEHFKNIKTKKITVLDLGIPIQVDPACMMLDGVDLLDLDRLQETGIANTVDSFVLQKLEAQLEIIVHEFKRFCKERDLVTVLKTTQTQHERYVHKLIPELLDRELSELSNEKRKQIAFKMRGLLREYTNSIFNSIHQASMEESDEQ